MKTYTEKINSINSSNEKTAICKHCGNMINVNSGIIQKSNKGNYYYICIECNNLKYNYTVENNRMVNGAKKHNMTHSFELESDSRNNRLYEYNFIPTRDATVAIEWKTPIYKSLNGLKKILDSIYKDGLITVTQRVGTHSNVGFINGIGREKQQLLKKYYHILFIPLSNHLISNKIKTEKLFGRKLGYWSSAVNEFTNPLNHNNYINITHKSHLENRLSVFRNPTQFMQVIKFNVDLLQCIQSNLFENFDRGMSDEKLDHKAHIISKKLIKLFNKNYDLLVKKEGVL